MCIQPMNQWPSARFKAQNQENRISRKHKCTLMFIVALFVFPVAQMIKNPPAMQETWVGSLDQEDPLEKEVAVHSSTLAWRIPWTEEPGGLQSLGSQTVGHN